MRLSMRRRSTVWTVAAALVATAACGGGGGTAETPTVQINGAGATFPYPIYSKWFSEYNALHPNVRINYQSIGSGGGIRQMQNQTVFFGATDGPMTAEQIAGAPGTILHQLPLPHPDRPAKEMQREPAFVEEVFRIRDIVDELERPEKL